MSVAPAGAAVDACSSGGTVFCIRIVTIHVLRDNPVLTMLGRRGRGDVVQALLEAPRTWSVRALARAAGVHAATAARTVKELEALGAVDVVRPGRDARLRLNASPVAQALAALRVPDVRGRAAATFAAAYGHRAPCLRWQAPGEHDADPLVPTRIAVRAEDDAAVDAVGPALDAVRAAGWPAPDITWHDVLDPADATARAILQGTPLTARRSGT